jgi:hypothetical protein
MSDPLEENLEAAKRNIGQDHLRRSDDEHEGSSVGGPATGAESAIERAVSESRSTGEDGSSDTNRVTRSG